MKKQVCGSAINERVKSRYGVEHLSAGQGNAWYTSGMCTRRARREGGGVRQYERMAKIMYYNV